MSIEISVIIPVYNVEKYIRQCVDSVLNQTFQERIEIILVNDGSTDNSEQIVREYEKQYPEVVRVISQKNQGLSATRNVALNIAQGKFLVFIDSDDYIGPNHLEALYGKAIETDADMVICDYTRVTAEGEFYKRFFANHIEKGVRIPSYISCNRIVKRALFEEYQIRYKVGIICEDIPVMLKLEALAKHVEVIPMAEYYYRMNPKSITSTFAKKKLRMEQLPFDALRDSVEFCMDKEHMIEYEMLEFYLCRIWTSLIFDVGRRCDKGVRKEMCREVASFMQQYFPKCYKNKYVKLTYFTGIPKAHKWGTWLFVKALRYHMLNVLIYIC